MIPKKNLDRQVYEGHKIATNKCDILVNSKSEFHGPAVPRVTTTKEPTANNNSNNRSRKQGSWIERSSYLVFPSGKWRRNIFKNESFTKWPVISDVGFKCKYFCHFVSNFSLTRILRVEKLCGKFMFWTFI